ncbi:MAG: glycerophosphodiester phosphodiesterase [Thiotrichales bacterium]|nr:glycerophosphodiester phosphodiesterase [Thiotrichales bacterium]
MSGDAHVRVGGDSALSGTAPVFALRLLRRATLIALLCGLGAMTMTAGAIEIQGHRGARGLLPENTIPAFERAIELGVDTLELDLGMTRDGVPVVHHDRALDPNRTRDATGAWLTPPGPFLNALDLAELSEFDVGRAAPGSPVTERFPDQEPRDDTRIPTLAEVLALGRRPGAGTVRFNIEIKISPLVPQETAGPAEFARALVEVLQAEGMMNRADLQSFDWRVLHEARGLAPEISTVCLTAEQPWHDNLLRGRPEPSPWMTGLDIDAFDGSVPRLVKAAGCAGWSPYYRDLTEETLAEAHALGLRVVVWTVNEVSDMLTLARLGVDGIITDYPDRALEALAPWRSHE